MKLTKLFSWPRVAGFLLVFPMALTAAIREIPVPNGSLEVMWSADETTTEFTVPFILDGAGMTKIGTDGIGKTDWGGGIDVYVPGWVSTDNFYDISPFNSTAAMGDGIDITVNGHVVLAVNPPGWGASQVDESVATGVYTVSYGSGWMTGASAYTEIPNVIVTLQYSTDGGTTWMELEDAAANMWSNKSSVAAGVAIGEWSNDFYVAYEVASDSSALGADLRVHLTTDTPTDAALADNFRLFHSDNGQIVQDLSVDNSSIEVMWSEDEAMEYTVPYTLLTAGLTKVGTDGIGNDDWGGGIKVFTPGWLSTDNFYDFSPMTTDSMSDSIDKNVNGHNLVALNPPGWGSTMVHDTVEATTYAVVWGAGWQPSAGAFPEIPDVSVSLQYSTDGGTTWMELADASTESSNKAEVSATVELGGWSNEFTTTYEVDSSSPAIGGMLQVYVTTTAATDAPVFDRIMVGKVVDAPTGGPGLFADYPLVGSDSDTGDWLGWVYVDGYPYVFLWSTSGWAYADEASGSDSGAWFYFYK